MSTSTTSPAFLPCVPFPTTCPAFSRRVASPARPHKWRAAAQSEDPCRVANTPCFTASILQSPMPRDKRAVYLSSVTESLSVFLTDLEERKRQSSQTTQTSTPTTPTTPVVAQINLLVPQLDPSLDVYDRRFLLQLVWAVISATVSTHRLRTRLLVQGRRAFGAIPLSVSGLRRHIDADLDASRDQWPEGFIRSADLEQFTQLDHDDDALVIVSPTNAVSIPVIDSVIQLVQSARSRPVIILNPRLDDVPSHSGVMQVAGRSQRLSFLQSIVNVFYLRVLYNPGSSYPPRGILFYQWPGPWQVWRVVNVDQDYSLIMSSNHLPDSSAITEAFRADAFSRKRNNPLKQAHSHMTAFDAFLTPQFILVFALVVAVSAAAYVRAGLFPLHYPW